MFTSLHMGELLDLLRQRATTCNKCTDTFNRNPVGNMPVMLHCSKVQRTGILDDSHLSIAFMLSFWQDCDATEAKIILRSGT